MQEFNHSDIPNSGNTEAGFWTGTTAYNKRYAIFGLSRILQNGAHCFKSTKNLLTLENSNQLRIYRSAICAPWPGRLWAPWLGHHSNIVYRWTVRYNEMVIGICQPFGFAPDAHATFSDIKGHCLYEHFSEILVGNLKLWKRRSGFCARAKTPNNFSVVPRPFRVY